MHALSVATGSERPYSPVVLQATISGNGDGSQNGTLTYNAMRQHVRAGLVFTNGIVYVISGSYGDAPLSWVLGYDAKTLQQVSVFCTSPNGLQSGIWQGGASPAVDDVTGHLYFRTPTAPSMPTLGDGVATASSN